MRRLVLAPEALADLDEIWEYIADDNIEAADRVTDELVEACERLRSTSDIGRRRDELTPGLRSWPLSSYVIFYRTSGDAVEIARVLHGARDIESLFRS